MILLGERRQQPVVPGEDLPHQILDEVDRDRATAEVVDWLTARS